MRRQHGLSVKMPGAGSILAIATLLVAMPASSSDGVIEINQLLAVSGGLTTGDDPGFPIEISEPGSYRLTSDLQVRSATADAIEIRSSHVTLDMGGFAIRCSSLAPCAGRGVVRGVFNIRNTLIRNGSIIGMGNANLGSGILVGFGIVSRVQVIGGTAAINTNGGSITDSSAQGSGNSGTLGIMEGTLLLRNVVSDSTSNTFGSIFSGSGVMAENVSSDNAGDTFKGTGVFLSNTATLGSGGAGADGFQVGFSVVSGNTVSGHGGDGVVGRANLVKGNTLRANDDFAVRCFSDGPSGYRENVITNHASDVSADCVNLGNNACDGGFCP